MLWALSVPIDIQTKLTMTLLLGIPAHALPPWNYFDTKKLMIQAGHSEDCSRRISRIYMLRASLYSKFKIMNNKDDGKRWW